MPHFMAFADITKWAPAVKSGLQRHVTPEMGAFFEQSYATGQSMYILIVEYPRRQIKSVTLTCFL